MAPILDLSIPGIKRYVLGHRLREQNPINSGARRFEAVLFGEALKLSIRGIRRF